MALAFIGLGSNLGDGCKNLLEAWRRLGLEKGVALLALSNPFLSKPVLKLEWLATGQELGEGLFTNAVGMLTSRLAPHQLLTVMQEIETAMGRNRAQSVDRSIDLDLLYYDDLVMVGPDLQLPHPEIQARRFVLEPLAELAPDFRHPRLGLTTTEMLQHLGVDEAEAVLRIDWPKRQDASGPRGKSGQ